MCQITRHTTNLPSSYDHGENQNFIGGEAATLAITSGEYQSLSRMAIGAPRARQIRLLTAFEVMKRGGRYTLSGSVEPTRAGPLDSLASSNRSPSSENTLAIDKDPQLETD